MPYRRDSATQSASNRDHGFLAGIARLSTKAKEGNLQPRHSANYSAPASINRELAVLSHLFSQAVEWKWIDRRPAKIKRIKEDNGRIVYFTVEQVGTLIEHAKVDDNPQIYPFIAIGVQTAMRLGEILSIRKQDVDLDRRVIFIPVAKTGTREQPMTANLAEFLAGYIKSLPADAPWLFPSPTAKDRHTVDIRKPFIRVVKAAGLDPKEYVRHTLYDTKGARKQPRAHRLPLTDRAAEIIARLLESEGEAPYLLTSNCTVPVRIETLSHVGAEISGAMLAAKTARAPFQIRDIRRTCETMLASMGISKDIRAQILSHGIGGVQDRHYDRHDYMNEKRAALDAWDARLAQIADGTKRQNVVRLRRKV